MVMVREVKKEWYRKVLQCNSLSSCLVSTTCSTIPVIQINTRHVHRALKLNRNQLNHWLQEPLLQITASSKRLSRKDKKVSSQTRTIKSLSIMKEDWKMVLFSTHHTSEENHILSILVLAESSKDGTLEL